MADRDPSPVADPSRARILEEASQIAAAPEFVRAPIMQRLLNFLVGETLAGRGDQLKAYTVAVDGLGRCPDFDARSDSYPRVQVGRLRKLLDRHYAHHPRPDGMRLYVPHGGYRVAIEQIAAVGPEASFFPKKGGWRLPHFIALGLSLAALLALGLFVGPRILQDEIVKPPVLLMSQVSAPGFDPGRREAIRATLLDALRRSNMFQLSTPERSGELAEEPVEPRYGLGIDVTPGPAPMLHLRLWQARSDRLLWSDKLALPEDPGRYAEVLAPLIAAIAQPFGAIATAERAAWRGQLRPGYPCMLLFHEFSAQRAFSRHDELEDCLQQTMKRSADDASALAAASMVTLDAELFKLPSRIDADDRESPRIRAWALARRAVAVDPFNALANRALSRASLFIQACPAAVRSGIRAATLDPYDPTLLSSVGVYLLSCEDPRGEAFARRALLLDPNTPTYHFPFVFLAIFRGDSQAARAAVAQLEQPIPAVRTFYHLAAAIALAADGDQAGARRAWERLKVADPEVARDPESLLRRWQFAPRMRERSMAALAKAGLIPPSQPTTPRHETGTASTR